jgi:hypothetical protein
VDKCGCFLDIHDLDHPHGGLEDLSNLCTEECTDRTGEEGWKRSGRGVEEGNGENE